MWTLPTLKQAFSSLSLLPDQPARMSPRPRESLADCELSDEALTTCYNRMKDLDGKWVSSSSGVGTKIQHRLSQMLLISSEQLSNPLYRDVPTTHDSFNIFNICVTL